MERIEWGYALLLAGVVCGVWLWIFLMVREKKADRPTYIPSIAVPEGAGLAAADLSQQAEREGEILGSWMALRQQWAEEPVRYLIEVSDWGPDFTGEDGTLHRWRWLVWDADATLKRQLGLDESEVGTQYPFMLGNAPSKRRAYDEAMAWIERQQHPLIVVKGV